VSSYLCRQSDAAAGVLAARRQCGQERARCARPALQRALSASSSKAQQSLRSVGEIQFLALSFKVDYLDFPTPVPVLFTNFNSCWRQSELSLQL
jgi:hypothetical protein